MGGWAKMLPLIFFFKYLQNEKRYHFALLLLLVIIYFERFCQISREKLIGSRVIVILSEGYRKIQKKKIFFFFETTFFEKYFKYTLC